MSTKTLKKLEAAQKKTGINKFSGVALSLEPCGPLWKIVKLVVKNGIVTDASRDVEDLRSLKLAKIQNYFGSSEL